jgi:hypothetical protein
MNMTTQSSFFKKFTDKTKHPENTTKKPVKNFSIQKTLKRDESGRKQ